jgi:large subunit ribosomal protein L6
MLNKFYNLSLNKYFFKKIFITSSIKLKFFFFKTQKILVLSNVDNSYYFVFPPFLDVLYQNNYLYIIIKENTDSIKYKTLYFFLIHFYTALKQLLKVSSTTFLIRGVGLKISFLENSNSILKLKLGFSHLIFLSVPAGIHSVSLFKKKFILSSFNKMLLGNFANILYKYKPINIFTGKGLLKKQKKKFKLKEYVKKI